VAVASSPFAGQRGTILLTLLFLVVVLGLAASLAGQALKDYVQREREDELLWRGQQYRQAIASYVRGQGSVQVYPSSLEDLLRDPRFPGVIRHLRRPYDDPMTGQPWELIRDGGNRVIGVRSTSTLKPFRQAGFDKELEALNGKSSYREWEFVYIPTRAGSRQSSPGSAPAAVNKGIPQQ
jgi:type II secretory pathway pseudopilin PulG